MEISWNELSLSWSLFKTIWTRSSKENLFTKFSKKKVAKSYASIVNSLIKFDVHVGKYCKMDLKYKNSQLRKWAKK